MKCPHCSTSIHENWDGNNLVRGNQYIPWSYRTLVCPECRELVIEVRQQGEEFSLLWPRGANRGPVPSEVPPDIANDYKEACNVLPISAKASAALARRCLQNVLHSHGYKDKDLSKEIDQLLNEKDASKGISSTLRATVDGIRNFGNFSAHPITDVTSLQIIDVEPHEAEWCLETLEEMFDHFYVKPAHAKAKKAALDAKLKAAGKPASK